MQNENSVKENFAEESDHNQNTGRVNDLYNINTLSMWVDLAESGGSVRDFLDKNSIRKCAVYGAGILGRCLLRALGKDRVHFFIDKSGLGIDDIPCHLPSVIPDTQNIDAIIITPGFDKENILKNLKNVRIPILFIEDIVYKYSMDKLYDVGKYAKCAYESGVIKHPLGYYAGKKMAQNLCSSVTLGVEGEKADLAYKCIINGGISIPLIDLIVSTKCTLRCKKCFHLIPSYYKEGNSPFDIKAEQILSDIQRITDAVDFVARVNILGGEPFVHSELGRILEEIKKIQNVGVFVLITNGTVIPDDSICEQLSDKAFYVLINDYGTEYSKADTLFKKLKKYNVGCRVFNDIEWYDFGPIQKIDYSEEEQVDRYEKCIFSQCKALMMGEMHTCAFIKHAERNGILPTTHQSLVLDKFKSRDQLRQGIISFYKMRSFDSCDYCRAPSEDKHIVVKAGEQE